MSLRLLAGIWCILIGVAASFAQAEGPKDFVYKTTKQADLKIKAYFPADWKADQKRPAIVFFFGGGWNGGKISQFEPQSKRLAEGGMVAFCADYRVKSRHGVSPDVCVEDAKSAIRWVRQNAGTLGVDPDRIVAAGGSAGGHIAACTGLCSGLEAEGEDQTVSSKPNALVLFNPVLDLDSPRFHERVGSAKLALSISPLQHLAADSPPSLLLFGTDDGLASQGKAYVKRAEELDNRAEFYTAEGVGHGFFNRQPWLDRTMARAEQFLTSLDYLKAAAATKR